MNTPVVSALLALVAGTAPAAIPVFIGTGSNSNARGIYQSELDPETGRLTTPKLAAEAANPGFLAKHPALPVLLAVCAPREPFADGSGAVAAFAIGENHSLRFLGETSSGGKNPCHLAIDASGKTVAVANYSDGTFATIRLDEHGVPGAIASLVRSSGSGPNADRQQAPHAHGVYFNRANNRLFVPDLGIDKVIVHPFDAATSKLGDPLPPLPTAPGAGPRHLAFSPDERHVYVVNELDNTVLAAEWTGDAFRASGTWPTLADEFDGRNTTAEIEVSADGRFVYASNRGHDSIAVFRRNPADGTLERIQIAPCGGRTPRHFAIAPGGKWLLCGHQQSDTISVLPRDPETGKLGEPTSSVACPSPICILYPFSGNLGR